MQSALTSSAIKKSAIKSGWYRLFTNEHIASWSGLLSRLIQIGFWIPDNLSGIWSGRALREADKDWPATAHWLHRMTDLEYWKGCWIV